MYLAIKVNIHKMNNISLFGQKERLEICCMFFKDGVEEMMRSASRFVILFPVNNRLHFPKKAGMSSPLFGH